MKTAPTPALLDFLSSEAVRRLGHALPLTELLSLGLKIALDLADGELNARTRNAILAQLDAAALRLTERQ